MAVKKLIVLLAMIAWGWAFVQLPPPPGAIGPYFNGIFPKTTPGVSGTWQLEELVPGLDIPSPVRIIEFPSSDSLLVLSKGGKVFLLDANRKSYETVLDISERTFKLGDCGSVGMAVHPSFFAPDHPDKRLFIFYKTTPNPGVWSDDGYNRLASFTWNPATGAFDPDSEQILIQQYDRSPWHDGGSMFFGPEGFLYLGLGDEGFDEHQTVSTQRLDGGFFSGILRIDIDNDPTRSHPVRRQPLANANPPPGWPETFSNGYSIPNGNPWHAEDGSVLEEFIALGIRSPFTMDFDADRGAIWVADVGSDIREEINLVYPGDNCQWPFMEGNTPSQRHNRPSNLVGNERPVYFEYEREVGTCVIGGGVYRHARFASLNEKYLFADYTRNKIMALATTGMSNEPEFEVLIADIGSQPVNLPAMHGITGIFPLTNGEVLVAVMGESYDDEGKIYKLKSKTLVPDPPALLSELGVFADMKSLEPVAGAIPYGVNAPLWSDGASKRRWIAIPNDGEFDAPDEQVVFSPDSEWIFPEGTVFIKHFEMPSSGSAGPIRLETRFFVIGQGGASYGLTYKWNEEGTEAVLLGGGAERILDITDDNGNTYEQQWDFPSRDQCITCHNSNAGSILGVNTRQINREGDTGNQLEYLDAMNIFKTPIGNADQYMRSAHLDDPDADLEWKIRSYIDANCGSCHRYGGIPDLNLDFTIGTSVNLTDYYNFPVSSHASDPANDIITPGDHMISELYLRDASLTDNQMPPLARNYLDEVYLDSLAYWIDNIDASGTPFNHDLMVFPNPATDWVTLRFDSQWTGPKMVHIHSVNGRLLMQKVSETRFDYINIGAYHAGTYYITVISGDERRTEKIIKVD